VWLTYSARSTADRIFAILPPITAFVAAGFEHSIANIYFIPIALLIKAGAPDALWTAIGRTTAAYPGLTWKAFLVRNLLPVTLGNIIGGALLVGAVYWFVYLRPRASAPSMTAAGQSAVGPEAASRPPVASGDGRA
jgi:formate/nitrite transporter FocA (FNT family)